LDLQVRVVFEKRIILDRLKKEPDVGIVYAAIFCQVSDEDLVIKVKKILIAVILQDEAVADFTLFGKQLHPFEPQLLISDADVFGDELL
jgi:hypothetical protein